MPIEGAGDFRKRMVDPDRVLAEVTPAEASSSAIQWVADVLS